jgi:hypothetical protein
MGKYRILSFDGGGVRGIVSLGMVKRLCVFTQDAEWYREAELYAGTSTGGLIALGLAAGKELEEIEPLYTEYGPKIFDRRTFLYLSSFWRFLHIGYENKVLRERLDELLGSTLLTRLEKRILLSSFSLQEDEEGHRHWGPKIFHNFPYKPDERLARDVGLYTSAAPTFLPSVDGFVDGAICASNPSMCAMAQALDGRQAFEGKPHGTGELSIVSVGTGSAARSIPNKSVRWGFLGWNATLVRMVMGGMNSIADYQCRHILGESGYLRLQVELDRFVDTDDAALIPYLQEAVAGIPEAEIRAQAAWIDEHW